MKSSLTWMQDYVDVDMNQDMQAFADTLTIAGIPVEQVEYWGTEIKKVITGKILEIEKHPDADKLVVCQVDMGDEQLQIVTAATNVRVGQIVPVAVHGAHLPGGTKSSVPSCVASYRTACSARLMNSVSTTVSSCRKNVKASGFYRRTRPLALTRLTTYRSVMSSMNMN